MYNSIIIEADIKKKNVKCIEENLENYFFFLEIRKGLPIFSRSIQTVHNSEVMESFES